MLSVTPAIAYCGPIARAGEAARGGFEAANRRLIDDLRRAGLDVVELPYAPERKPKWRQILAYGASFAGLAWRIATRGKSWDIFHITPLRRQFILAELLLCTLARWRGAKLVVDLRAGAIAEDLANPNKLRRKALERMLQDAALVCVEAEAYLPLVRPFIGNTFYLPNYVDAATVGAPAVAPGGQLTLVFLGRVVPEKGIEAALDCLRVLRANGHTVRLKVIGRGEDDYVESLKAASADLPVEWLGAVPHPQVPTQLQDAHFFVFPTRHRGEGHSNALTEAMSHGLVPVVADNGFNRQVVAATGTVLSPMANGADYAAAIETILVDGRWEGLSAAARQRVFEQFTGARLVPQLLARYGELIGMNVARTFPQRRRVKAES